MDASYFILPNRLESIDCDDDTDVRYPMAFAEKFIREFTEENGVVFDPFAGFGTTLLAAQKL